MRTLLATFIVASALGACSKNEPPAPATTTPEPSVTPAATPVPSAAIPAPSASAATAEPPTEEDFEDEASDKVTVKTLDAQLDALEKEIQAD